MTINVSPELASYALAQTVQQLEVRVAEYGSVFRCVSCRGPLADEPEQRVVVFDPHFGHSCGESGPILVGLNHEKCHSDSVFPYSQKDLPRFIHPQQGFFGRRGTDAPTCAVVSTLAFDVLWVQADGTTEEPWLSASLRNGSTRIDDPDELASRIRSAPHGWIEVADQMATVFLGGQAVFDFDIEPEMEQWLVDAQGEGSMVFIQSSLRPHTIGESKTGIILDSADLTTALTEIVGHEPAAAVSVPIRSTIAAGKGAVRNDLCPCLSGTKFKRCCGQPRT